MELAYAGVGPGAEGTITLYIGSAIINQNFLCDADAIEQSQIGKRRSRDGA